MRKFIAKNARIIGYTLDAEPHAQIDIEADEIGDEYHTMHELYQHRMALTSALTKFLECGCSNYYGIRSKSHADGTMFEGDYFIVAICYVVGTRDVMIASYHYEMKYWDKFDHCITLERAPEYDGHTSQDVIERLINL